MILSALSFLNMSFADILDIVVVAALIFVVIRWIRHSSAINVFIAIILLFVVRELALLLGMKMLSSLLGTVLDLGVLALVIIFQPDIRRFLFRIGSGAELNRSRWAKVYAFFGLKGDSLGNDAISQIAEACNEMSEQKTGALIVLRRRGSLDYIMETGDRIDAKISKRLIMSIFFKNSPLHDGAVVIGGDKILAARCTLPITAKQDVPARFGMRHKSAIGMTEESDADVIVVSEETGGISFVRQGEVTAVHGINELKLLLGNSGVKEDEQ